MTTSRFSRAAIAAAALLAAAACSPGQSPQAPAAPGAGGSRSAAPAPVGGAGTSTPGATLVARVNHDFSVEVDRAWPRDARLFQCDTRGKLLVDLPTLSKSVLVDLAARRATTVSPATIVREEESGLVRFTEPDPAASPTSALAIDGAILRFQTDASTVRVMSALEREPIVGPVTLETLVADRAEYREGMKAYRPNLEAIANIRKSKTPIAIEAYFGTWCSHCKMFMPKFLRVIQDAGNPAITLTLVGVPKGFGNVAGPWQGKNITGIPAIILSRQGSEMARLDSHDHAVPESELAAILGSIK